MRCWRCWRRMWSGTASASRPAPKRRDTPGRLLLLPCVGSRQWFDCLLASPGPPPCAQAGVPWLQAARGHEGVRSYMQAAAAAGLDASRLAEWTPTRHAAVQVDHHLPDLGGCACPLLLPHAGPFSWAEAPWQACPCFPALRDWQVVAQGSTVVTISDITIASNATGEASGCGPACRAELRRASTLRLAQPLVLSRILRSHVWLPAALNAGKLAQMEGAYLFEFNSGEALQQCMMLPAIQWMAASHCSARPTPASGSMPRCRQPRCTPHRIPLALADGLIKTFRHFVDTGEARGLLAGQRVQCTNALHRAAWHWLVLTPAPAQCSFPAECLPQARTCGCGPRRGTKTRPGRPWAASRRASAAAARPDRLKAPTGCALLSGSTPESGGARCPCCCRPPLCSSC